MSERIFDLEQEIMRAWNVVDDIDMIYHYLGDDPKFVGLEARAEDELMNLLLGIKSLYSLKFEKLFNTFEDVCREYHERGRELEYAKASDRKKIDEITELKNQLFVKRAV